MTGFTALGASHVFCPCELSNHWLTACVTSSLGTTLREVCGLSGHAQPTSVVMCRASVAWARSAVMLLHSLVLCAAAACAVGLLCSSSGDISDVPAVNLRVVLALFLACAPFALQPFAHASPLLAAEEASCKPLHLTDALACCKDSVQSAITTTTINTFQT